MTTVNSVTTDEVEVQTGRRLRADAARNQQRILAAARELFATRGLEITLDDVAEHAGVGVGTVYRRFANKQQLIDGVFEENIGRMAEQAELALQHPDPWEGLVQYLEYACENMALNRGLGEVISSLDDGRERVARVRERMQPLGEQLIERASATGALRPGIESGDFFAFIYMIGSFADFARAANQDTWRRYFAILLDGLRADCGRRDPLTVRALTGEEIDRAKAACLGPKR